MDPACYSFIMAMLVSDTSSVSTAILLGYIE